MAAVASKAREGREMKGRRGVFIVPERPVRSNQQGVTYSLGARSPSTAPPLHSNYRLCRQSRELSGGGSLHDEERGTVHKHTESTIAAVLFDFRAVWINKRVWMICICACAGLLYRQLILCVCVCVRVWPALQLLLLKLLIKPSTIW